jgi:hypothetical protein
MNSLRKRAQVFWFQQNSSFVGVERLDLVAVPELEVLFFARVLVFLAGLLILP